MKLHLPSAEIFIPDGRPVADALARVTHLGIGAHQDDLEFMAFHGILQCFHSDSEWFGGVTCTNGSGSARSGPYANFSDEEMMAVRRKEQRHAAIVGRYAAMVQLDYPSAVAKDTADSRLRADLRAILDATRPRVVYTHNPADKHDTHIAVVVPVIQAIRSLPRNQRPEAVHGCERSTGFSTARSAEANATISPCWAAAARTRHFSKATVSIKATRSPSRWTSHRSHTTTRSTSWNS